MDCLSRLEAPSDFAWEHSFPSYRRTAYKLNLPGFGMRVVPLIPCLSTIPYFTLFGTAPFTYPETVNMLTYLYIYIYMLHISTKQWTCPYIYICFTYPQNSGHAHIYIYASLIHKTVDMPLCYMAPSQSDVIAYCCANNQNSLIIFNCSFHSFSCLHIEV